jgi:molecular chaperone Hsp33
MDNYLQKAYCMNQTVRIYAAITTDIVKHAEEIFNLWPTSCSALGRTLTMAAIMSCTYKNDDYLTIKILGDGSIGKIIVGANDGKVRGFCENPGVDLRYNDGKQAVAKAVGAVQIEVIKDLHMRAPFSSSSEIISGEIAEDFTYYFAKSEQIPSPVGLGVLFDKESKVKAAGGFLIQVMPGCKEEYLEKLEAKLSTLKSCSTMIDEGYSAEDIIKEITDGDYQLLETKELKYECTCSKERFERGLLFLGKEELISILNEDHKAEINCNFCNKKYIFSENDLKSLILKATK